MVYSTSFVPALRVSNEGGPYNAVLFIMIKGALVCTLDDVRNWMGLLLLTSKVNVSCESSPRVAVVPLTVFCRLTEVPLVPDVELMMVIGAPWPVSVSAVGIVTPADETDNPRTDPVPGADDPETVTELFR